MMSEYAYQIEMGFIKNINGDTYIYNTIEENQQIKENN